ncbi:MAG TPA: VOC family protein [Gaiellaceae bacterium]|nr:VOC family protein [Gaiellaceae bacterium]
MNPTSLDHVALWVADPQPIADFLVEHLGMHVIEQTERFTLVGSDARHGKLTLFAADGPRDLGALGRIGLRVSDLEAARSSLPAGTPDDFDVGEGLRLTLVEAETEVEYDLDHVALLSPDPEAAAREWLRYGFAPAGAARVRVGSAFLELHEGDPGDPERPLLNHLGVLVDEAAPAQNMGFDVADVVDAPNTFAVFVWGPDRVKLEYVEHKPSFSLR